MSNETKLNNIAKLLNDKNNIFWKYINKNVPYKFREDLQQEMLLILFAKPDKLIKAYDENWLHYLYFNIIEKQWKSSNSPFYKTYKKNDTYIDCFDDIVNVNVDDVEFDYVNKDLEFKLLREEQNNKLNIALSNTHLTWYENELYKMFYQENKSTRQIATEFDINHVGIWKAINIINDKIKANIPTEINN